MSVVGWGVECRCASTVASLYQQTDYIVGCYRQMHAERAHGCSLSNRWGIFGLSIRE